MDMLDSHLLLAFAAMTIECVEEQGIGPGKFVGLAQGLTMAFERLLLDHSAPVALHGGVVRSEDLSREHRLKLVPGRDAGKGRNCCVYLAIFDSFVRISSPERPERLIAKSIVPMVGS